MVTPDDTALPAQFVPASFYIPFVPHTHALHVAIVVTTALVLIVVEVIARRRAS
jgi:hypothetical protein